jgi:hypothetical protein
MARCVHENFLVLFPAVSLRPLASIRPSARPRPPSRERPADGVPPPPHSLPPSFPPPAFPVAGEPSALDWITTPLPQDSCRAHRRRKKTFWDVYWKLPESMRLEELARASGEDGSCLRKKTTPWHLGSNVVDRVKQRLEQAGWAGLGVGLDLASAPRMDCTDEREKRDGLLPIDGVDLTPPVPKLLLRNQSCFFVYLSCFVGYQSCFLVYRCC